MRLARPFIFIFAAARTCGLQRYRRVMFFLLSAILWPRQQFADFAALERMSARHAVIKPYQGLQNAFLHLEPIISPAVASGM